jgi:hypothetical protein
MEILEIHQNCQSFDNFRGNYAFSWQSLEIFLLKLKIGNEFPKKFNKKIYLDFLEIFPKKFEIMEIPAIFWQYLIIFWENFQNDFL